MNKSEINSLLYTDESGVQSSIYDVQLIEVVPTERVPKLIELLNNEDKYVAYQAMLVLIAWGIEKGFANLDDFIAKELDQYYEYEPHRIWGADNVYDVIAKALKISIYNTNDEGKIIPYLSKLLKLYGTKYFDSELKYTLLKIEPRKELLPDIVNGLERALNKERYFQASQLLPVIAKYEKAVIDSYIVRFEGLVKYDERIQYNLDEIKEYI